VTETHTERERERERARFSEEGKEIESQPAIVGGVDVWCRLYVDIILYVCVNIVCFCDVNLFFL